MDSFNLCVRNTSAAASPEALVVLAAMHRANAASLSRYLLNNPGLPPPLRGALRASIADKLAQADAADRGVRAAAKASGGGPRVVGEVIAAMLPPGHPSHVEKDA